MLTRLPGYSLSRDLPMTGTAVYCGGRSIPVAMPGQGLEASGTVPMGVGKSSRFMVILTPDLWLFQFKCRGSNLKR